MRRLPLPIPKVVVVAVVALASLFPAPSARAGCKHHTYTFDIKVDVTESFAYANGSARQQGQFSWIHYYTDAPLLVKDCRTYAEFATPGVDERTGAQDPSRFPLSSGESAIYHVDDVDQSGNRTPCSWDYTADPESHLFMQGAISKKDWTIGFTSGMTIPFNSAYEPALRTSFRQSCGSRPGPVNPFVSEETMVDHQTVSGVDLIDPVGAFQGSGRGRAPTNVIRLAKGKQPTNPIDTGEVRLASSTTAGKWQVQITFTR